MIKICPGVDYFLRWGVFSVIPQLDSINRWLDENNMGERVTWEGNLIEDRHYIFQHEEDAVAFKLRFGL